MALKQRSKVRALSYAEAKAIETGKANRPMRRSIAKKTGKVLPVTGVSMSYEKKNMVVHKHPATYNQLCSSCHIRTRQNGSSRCKSCALPASKSKKV